MLKQQLQQKLLQKLSPQQIQTIKLLEIPAMELEQRIKKELEENPMLEEGESDEPVEISEDSAEGEDENTKDENDEFTLEDYINEDEDEYIPSYKTQTNNYSPDDNTKSMPYAGGTSFSEYLENQLGLRKMDEKKRTLAKYIIGNIDDDGYLRRDLESIVDDIAFLQNISTTREELEETLSVIHELEPVGVGARNLRECLLIQLRSKDLHSDTVRMAIEIITDHFDEFTKKHYDKIRQRLDVPEAELKKVIDEIIKLNPKPGGSFSADTDKLESVIPDFMLEYKDGEFILNLNSRNVPELRISKSYSDLLSGYSGKGSKKEQKEVVAFVKQKLDSAKWFIDAIRQRQNTLMGTMQAILNYQKEYFVEGDETKLKPMILKDIAQKVNLDISTISRVVNSKYIQTHFGIYPLKYFFSEAMQTESGEEISSREIKKILHDCIENEEKSKPLPDEDLTKILNDKGYRVARRTVAKYREQLGIPVARLRKELK